MKIDTRTVCCSDAYRSFLKVHTATNRIRLYMDQIPRSVAMWSNLLHLRSSNQSNAKVLSQVTANILRIGTSCTTLTEENARSFDDLKDLLKEIRNVKNSGKAAPPKKSNDELEPSPVTTTTKKPKRPSKGKNKQRSRKIFNSTNKASALCEAMPSNVVDSFRVLFNAAEALLSTAESFSTRHLPVPRADAFATKLNAFVEVLNNASDTAPEQFDETSQSFLREQSSMFTFSTAYYGISQKFIMPRLAALSLMLTARTDQDRHAHLKELCTNRTIIENELRKVIRQKGQKKIETTT